ncbi:MAG: hypothetical protein WAM82_26930 [Thermoanaerobaculia bacterium]
MPSSQKRSLPERRRRWDLVISNRKQLLEILPNLDGDLSELESVHKEIAGLVTKQAYYTAKAREVTTKIRTLSRKADRLRGRVGASLRGKHGFDASELIAYGFNPRRTNQSLEIESRPDPVDDFPGGGDAE